MEDARETLIRLTINYPQRSMIIYGQFKRKSVAVLRQVQASKFKPFMICPPLFFDAVCESSSILTLEDFFVISFYFQQ